MMANRILVEKSGDFYEVHDWQTNETIFVSEDLESCQRFITQLKAMSDDNDLVEHWLDVSEVMNPQYSL